MSSNASLLLASGSPRRRELLQGMGVSFEVVVADVQELDGASRLDPVALALANARMKAKAVGARYPERWVLGADTVVSLAGRIFGKPSSLDEAHLFLRTLCGREHEVITGCVLRGPAGAVEAFHEISIVRFKTFSEETLSRYLAEVEVLDKAGAYAVQERREWLVEKVRGSMNNVIGLPTERLSEILRSRGLL